jgi:hypothetical protein
MPVEMIFITVALHNLEPILQQISRKIVLDHGTTDRQGLGYLILSQGSASRRIVDDLLASGTLIDYTVFALDLTERGARPVP